MTMCEGCTADEHWRCGLQTWCQCPCDGSTDCYEVDPDSGLEMIEGDDDDCCHFQD
jgi:hypothetical protein